MSAPLADAPRVEIEDAISGKPFLSLTWHRLMPHHVEVEAWGTHDRLVRRLDRAGLAKLRDACNALLGETATTRRTLRINLGARTVERLTFDTNGQTEWRPLSANVEWGPASKGDVITVEVDLPDGR